MCVCVCVCVCVLSLWSSEGRMTSPTCILQLCTVCNVCTVCVLLSWPSTSEVCCSVCQTETQKKRSPPPVDLWYYTQVHNPYYCDPVQQYYCNTTAILYSNTTVILCVFVSETRRTASGIIYTMKSCSELSCQQEAPPAAADSASEQTDQLSNESMIAGVKQRNVNVCLCLWLYLNRWSSCSQESQTPTAWWLTAEEGGASGVHRPTSLYKLYLFFRHEREQEVICCMTC